ncbi:MAG: ATP synthase F1 subunit gamma [Candidatus Pacebacteria bacterium]|nr:ATP synthase F1 subunit gamma [Candidatus Paceibacterota bacterium]
MASTKEIKRRIKSVKSTKKITKAMELVAASKMKRAVSQTLASRIYSSYSWEILTSLSERIENITHPFFMKNSNEEKYLIVLITSNRGLCGGYNSQIIKKAISLIKNETGGQNVDIITVGKKGDSAMRRTGQNVVATFTDIPDNVGMQDIISLSTYIANEFKNEKYSKVYIAYTDFISALNQKPVIRKILPVSKEEFKEVVEVNLEEKKKGESAISYLVEGDINNLLDTLAEKLVRVQIYQMMLESNASEQSSRMVAMKNANEAAGEMIDDLTLVFNKARQANITREISEISAGMASIN